MQISPNSQMNPGITVQSRSDIPSPRRSLMPDLASFESRVARLREELQHSSKMNSNILEGLYDEILHTFESLNTISEEKQKLKEALQDVIHKKDELYKEALIYYNSWKKEAEKSSFLHSRLENAENVIANLEDLNKDLNQKLAESEVSNTEIIKRYTELQRVAKEYTKDRESIIQLMKQNEKLKKELEAIKSRKGQEIEGVDKVRSPLLGKISKLTEFILMKVKEYSELNQLFRNKVCKGSEFRNFVMKQNWEEAVYKLLQFISELITYQPEPSTPSSLRTQSSSTQTDLERYSESPVTRKSHMHLNDKSMNASFDTRVSPSSSLRTGPNSIFRSDEECNRLLHYSDNLLDSFHCHNDRLQRLNQQIHETMASSKRLLGSSPSKHLSSSSSRFEFGSTEKKIDIAESKLEPSEIVQESLVEDVKSIGIRVRDAKSPSKIPNISTTCMNSPKSVSISKSESESAIKQKLNTSVHINRIKKKPSPKIDTKTPKNEEFPSPKNEGLSRSTDYIKGSTRRLPISSKDSRAGYSSMLDKEEQHSS
jgi:hypothetical protein